MTTLTAIAIYLCIGIAAFILLRVKHSDDTYKDPLDVLIVLIWPFILIEWLRKR